MTEPAGTVVLDAVLTVPSVRPALPSAVVAAAWVRFTTFGTATGAPAGVNTIVGSKPVPSQPLFPSGPRLIEKFTLSSCTTVVVRSKPIPAVLPSASVCCHSTVAFFAMETLTPPPHPALSSKAFPVIRTEPACGATHRLIASAKLPGCPPLFQRSRYCSLPCHHPAVASNVIGVTEPSGGQAAGIGSTSCGSLEYWRSRPARGTSWSLAGRTTRRVRRHCRTPPACRPPEFD